MGFGRVISGVHYPLDIIGGAVVGILTAYVVFHYYYLFDKFIILYSLNINIYISVVSLLRKTI